MLVHFKILKSKKSISRQLQSVPREGDSVILNYSVTYKVLHVIWCCEMASDNHPEVICQVEQN